MILIDTHVLLWGLLNDRQLSGDARNIIDEAAAQGALWVSAITLWEIAMLAAKKRVRLQQDAGSWINAAVARSGVSVAAIDADIAVDAGELPTTIHGDPADRLIISTARKHGWPLLTGDRKILAYGANGHLAAIDARH